MYNPVSTYRIQFNKDFTLAHLDALLPYLHTLGVKTIYASPIFTATPESTHGYDGVDPTSLNPEIGTEAQLRIISERLHQHNMGWVQDIVPNHMAYHPNNRWLMDVLEKGSLSRYAQFFDTSLASSFFQGRIMAPFLPESLDESVNKGELTLDYDQERLMLKINGEMLPLKPGSYATVLSASAEPINDAIRQVLDELDQIRHIDEPEAYAMAWDELRLQLTALMRTPQLTDYVQACLTAVNNDPTLLRKLADEQHYRFCTEPETRQAMTYRRFFTINGLICLNVGDEAVFQYVHSLIKQLTDDGIFQGLRVDHVDGLFDPAQYVERLRKLVGDETYIVAEKILQGTEPLPTSWPVEGTSGYDFLAMVNNLLTDSRSESTFRTFYQTLVETNTALADRIRDRKAYFLAQYMGGELSNLYEYFQSLNLADEPALETLSTGALRLTIGQLLVRCPVYRYYGNHLPLASDEAETIQTLLETIRHQEPDLTAAVAVLEDVLLRKPLAGDGAYNQRASLFYQRLMQFSSPLMAKGVEDTLLYTYNCFIGHNEVGDSPERFGMSVGAFHRAMQNRQLHWPLAQSTTATHDTKRGEDVRARLNVLTNLPDEWLAEVQHWQALNATSKQHDSPDPNDEYFIYQNLLGAYPMPDQNEDDFPNRFRLYLEKALQEAKRHTTGWAVEESYHEGVKAFTDHLLDKQGKFWARFQTFHREIADFGIVNSLTQVMLKFTCPGMPDVYQGGEGWDLSLVDPDNRRPVNFEQRQQWLTELAGRQQAGDKTIWTDLWHHRFDGRVKFWLTQTLLHERQQNAALFWEGQYIPLAVEGAYRDHILAFARQNESLSYVVVVPLYTAQLCRQQGKDVLSIDWSDTRIALPADAPISWTDQLSGRSGEVASSILVQDVLQTLPVSLLRLA